MRDIGDFSVAVKNRAEQPKLWRWEIYRLGRKTPVTQSAVEFATAAEAELAGKKALRLFLSEYQAD